MKKKTKNSDVWKRSSEKKHESWRCWWCQTVHNKWGCRGRVHVKIIVDTEGGGVSCQIKKIGVWGGFIMSIFWQGHPLHWHASILCPFFFGHRDTTSSLHFPCFFLGWTSPFTRIFYFFSPLPPYNQCFMFFYRGHPPPSTHTFFCFFSCWPSPCITFFFSGNTTWSPNLLFFWRGTPHAPTTSFIGGHASTPIFCGRRDTTSTPNFHFFFGWPSPSTTLFFFRGYPLAFTTFFYLWTRPTLHLLWSEGHHQHSQFSCFFL